MATGGGNFRQVENIFQLLESSDTVKEIRDLILGDLATSKESTWLIHLLVDYYFQTQSTSVQEIIGEVREAQSKALMDKLLDGIKSTEHRLPALQLVLYLVYQELPWCRNLVETALFNSILKCLEKTLEQYLMSEGISSIRVVHQRSNNVKDFEMRTELDVPILMTSVMIVVILLPSVPVNIGPYLPRIFKIFGRLSIFCVKRPANTPEVYLLHLQVALYSLFHRLYGMYPCSFLAFIKEFCAQKENIHVYEEIIQPMLERVRLHPKLIQGQKEGETSSNRWKNQETQDIVVYCSNLSLDLIEGSLEDSHCPVFQSIQSVDKYRILNLMFPARQKTRVRSEAQNIPNAAKAVDDGVSMDSLYLPGLDESAVGESPSVLIGLSTPPSSQRTTPAASFLEPGGQGTMGDTPEMTPRQHTPSQTDDGEKTPLSRSSSKGNFQQMKSCEVKKSGVVTPKAVGSVSQTTPTTPGSHSLTSPATFSPVALAEASPFKSRPSAFGAPIQSRSQAARNLQFKSVEEQEEEGKGGGAGGMDPGVQGPAKFGSQSETDGSLTSKHAGSATTPSEIKQTERPPVPKIALPVDSLPQVIGNLPTPDTDQLDQEVEEINEKDDQFDEGHSPSSSLSTLASQTDVTAESVRQFMKKVNRIRFNSLTSNSSSDYDAASVAQGMRNRRARRPRSCPPFKRLSQQTYVGSDDNTATKGKPTKHASAGDGMVKGLGRQKSMIEGKFSAEMLSEDSSDDLASYSTASSKETPQKTKGKQNAQQDRESVEEIVPELPAALNPVFQIILAPSKLAVCNNCHQQLVVTSNEPQAADMTITTFKGNEVSLFSVMSPPELLDRHLRLGSDIHAKELTKIPLTSKESTNWTHFGGVPPVDEVNILRGQILLMQNQLMYERHKRLNHAKRNRRLLRRITHVTTLEEEQKTLRAQVHLLEEKMEGLNVTVKLLQADNRSLSQSQESDEYEKLVQFRTSLKENKDLKAASVVLKNLLLTQREDYDKQQRKLEHVEHKNLENEKELEICRERLANTEKLKQKVFQLQKEVLLMQEFNQKCQEKLHQNRAASNHKTEESYLINSLKGEISELKRENKKKSNLLEAYQTRMIELDELLKSKENAMNEIKRNFEVAKSCHDEQIKIVEERCHSMVHVNQQLEAKVMELTCQLDQATHKKMVEARKAAGTGGASGGTGGVGSSSNNSNTATASAPFNPDLGSKGYEMLKSDIDSSQLDTAEDALNLGSSTVEAQHTQNSSSKGVQKVKTSFDAGDSTNMNRNIPRDVSVVVAKDEVSIASSTFTETGSDIVNPGQLPTVSSHTHTDMDILSDSGAASRTSYRVDSDVSMRSVSGQSMTTGDSGCWPK